MNVLIAVNSKTISYEEFQTLKGSRVNAEFVVDYKGKLDGKYSTLLDGRIIRQYVEGEETAFQFVNSIPKNRYKPKAEPGPIKKSLNSLGEIGNDLTTAWGERTEKAFDSWYDFGNHFTFGALDMGKNVWDGNQALYQNRTSSPLDYFNWLSLGSVDMVRGAISPEEQFSKEHLLNSFGLFTMVAGGGLVKVKTGPAPKAVPTVRVPKKPVNMPLKQWVSQLKPPVIKSITNSIEWFRANFLDFDLFCREIAADGPGGDNGYYFAKDDFEGGARSSGRGRGSKESSDTPHLKEAKDIIAERTKGLDLNRHPTTTKQMSSKKMKELRDKIDNRTITKQEYADYIWNKEFAKRRDKGVKEFWYQEQQRLLNNEPLTRDWTQEQIKDILAGKTPKFDGKPIAGHHSYSASIYPHLADKGVIIYPATFNEHLKGWHGGNWRNSIPGEPIIPIKDF